MQSRRHFTLHALKPRRNRSFCSRCVDYSAHGFWIYSHLTGPPMIFICFVAALLPSLCSAAPVGDGLEVLVRSPVSARAGHTATLPCWLNPPQSTKALEIQWYRSDQHDSPIMVYKENKIVYEAKNTTFEGRVSFGTKDAASGGMKSGDVSLKLENLTLGDAGDYTCYVSGDQDYDRATVSLIVSKTGSPVFLSTAWKNNDTVNVSCESGGWYPEPRLQWWDPKEALTPTILKYSRDSSGLVSVHSWLLVSSSSEVSCSVGLDGEEAKEARVYLEGPTQSDEQIEESSPSVSGWVAFALLLVVMLAGLGLLWFKKREKIFSCKSKAKADSEENKKLLSREIKTTDLSKAKEFLVNIKLDAPGNTYVKVIADGRRVRDSQEAESLPEVTCLTALTGTPGFSSGQHYWEVSMKQPNTEVKRSWWLGVTRHKIILQQLTPSVSKGYWFLSSSSEHLQFNTDPVVSLPVRCRPETVGVYLDCDTGELSFYNVKENSLIGSLTGAVGEKLYPLFNTGLRDPSPMTLTTENKVP